MTTIAEDLDSEFLAVIQGEKQRSVGFDLDATLSADRTKALEYARGIMRDVPCLNNRSKAVSTDIADAIETLLPDLIEIFTSQDDVLQFIPTRPDDVDAAKQETDYLRKVIFQDNPGFKILYGFFKDALLCKTGIAVWRWEEAPDQVEMFEGKTFDEAAMALQIYRDQVEDIEPEQAPEDLQAGLSPTFKFSIRSPKEGSIKIEIVPPEHFTIAADATDFATTAYTAWRSYPRAQDLIASGISRDLVEQLPAHSPSTDMEGQVRDTVDETTNGLGGDGATADLRIVEIETHFVRTNLDGDLKLWKVVTGEGASVLISREQVSQVEMAAITPFIEPHRFYGSSIADKLFEIQKIKTALKRMVLDSGYFAINQRPIVDMTKVNDFTLSDLLNNVPAAPIRVAAAGAVQPFQGAGLGFDAFSALEFFSVEGEQRTGVVRNAQGLNPDTLHDTASGQAALMGAAQKRVRLIARVIAETGLKDLYLGVHAKIRECASRQQVVRLRGQWVPIDPTTWGERNNMEIELGATRDEEIALMMQQSSIMKEIVEGQQQAGGPVIVTPDNIYNMGRRIFERMNVKDVDSFLTNPANSPPQPPKPDPKTNAIQAQTQAQIAADQARAQADAQRDQQQMQGQLVLAQQKQAAELAMAQQKLQAQLEMQRQQGQAELALKGQEMAVQAHLDASRAYSPSDPAPMPQVNVGGQPG